MYFLFYRMRNDDNATCRIENTLLTSEPLQLYRCTCLGDTNIHNDSVRIETESVAHLS